MYLFLNMRRGVFSLQSVLLPLLTSTGPFGSSALRVLVIFGHFLLLVLRSCSVHVPGCCCCVAALYFCVFRAPAAAAAAAGKPLSQVGYYPQRCAPLFKEGGNEASRCALEGEPDSNRCPVVSHQPERRGGGRGDNNPGRVV